LKRSVLFSAIYLSLFFTCKAELIHRYNFDANADDQIESADGILEGNAVVSGGALVLNGSNGYMKMPGSTVAINTHHSISVEAWITINTLSTWARLFDFGDSYGSDGGYYWFFAPSSGGGGRLAIATRGFPGYATGEQLLDAPAFPTGTKIHVVCVYDGVNRQMRVYYNGSQVASNNITMLSANLRNTFAYIGKSLYSADPYLNASIDEFRIYNIPLNASMVQASYQAGPNSPITTYFVPSNPDPVDQGISGGSTTDAELAIGRIGRHYWAPCLSG